MKYSFIWAKLELDEQKIASNIPCKLAFKYLYLYFYHFFQECTHPTVMKNMCADCGLDLQKDMPATGFYPGSTGGRAGAGVTQPAPDASASIAVLHSIPELKVHCYPAEFVSLPLVLPSLSQKTIFTTG